MVKFEYAFHIGSGYCINLVFVVCDSWVMEVEIDVKDAPLLLD